MFLIDSWILPRSHTTFIPEIVKNMPLLGKTRARSLARIEVMPNLVALSPQAS